MSRAMQTRWSSIRIMLFWIIASLTGIASTSAGPRAKPASLTLVAVTLMLHVAPTFAQENLLSEDLTATQISTDGAIASQALDNKPETSSCTNNLVAKPWWTVKLDSPQEIGSLLITFPDVNDDGELDGLSDFLVGGYTHQPITDDLFNEASFTQCSQENMHTAQAGIDLQVTCDVLVTTEVIMIVSTSAIPVRLCLAEVKAYAYVETTTVTTATTMTTTPPVTTTTTPEPTTSPAPTEAPVTSPLPEGNLALDKDTEDISTYRSPSSAAVDGNPLSASCTDDDHGRPWWVVDLGAPTIVERVLIVAPAVNGENLHGLTDFQVGFLTYLPAEEEEIDYTTNPYPLCGEMTNQAVSISEVFTIECEETEEEYRYVIIQSQDAAAERLCLAEVGVYAPEEPTTTTVPPTTTTTATEPPTTTPDLEGCLSYKQEAIQISDFDGQTADLAVDGSTTTYSCSNNNRGNPWWVVNLGEKYEIGYLVITLPNVAGDDLNGLNNFQVGFLEAFPTTEADVEQNYPVCAKTTVTVFSGQVLTVNCDPSDTLYQYVIIHSLDNSAEKMCIAEVCVYEPIPVTTTPEVTTVAPTTTPAPDECLSTDKTTVQLSDDTDADRPAGLAVDFGNLNTYSCTDDLQGIPWWAVDLGEASAISHVILTLPSVSGNDLNGLNKFQVGFTTALPTAGVSIPIDSYTLCGEWNDVVSTGLEIRVDCDTPVTETYRYVIVQSQDNSAEKLCIADICVYAAEVPTTTPAVITTAAPTTTGAPPADECLSTNKPTAQIDVEVVGTSESSFAVDKDPDTHSCTQDNEAYPWWGVDLEEEYDIGSVEITLPAVNGDNLNGLDNFRVIFTSAMPTEGSAVDEDLILSACGELNEGVEISEVITVTCTASTDKYRYVVIESLDTRAEKMCIAEACIKLRVVTTVAPTVAATTTPTPSDCLSTDKYAIQISDEIEAGEAVDGLITTYSCTLNTRSWPWWVVDLGEADYIGKVVVTLPNVGGDNLNGLNNFRVVFPTSWPDEGLEVTIDEYLDRECGRLTVGVDVGLELTVDCAASTEQYQYVMIQSLDTSAEKLCIAEVCVYTTIVTTPAPTEAPTTTAAPSDCVSDNKDAVQSTERDPASLAVDGNAMTYSCTLDARSYPWWAVDLGQDYSIICVTITLPNVGGNDLNGLNNFKVGFLTTLPAADTAIEVKSYTECGSVSVGVEAGLVINIDCAATTEQYRYVIVQSADTSAESLCIAEVCVKEGVTEVTTTPAVVVTTAGPVVTTAEPVVTTAAASDCLSANKDTVQFTTDLESSLAVDNNVNTYSCTLDAEAYPWWAVDLGEVVSVGSVTVTLPNAGGNTLNGLNNFQVGFPSVFPTAGSKVDRKSYPLCGTEMVGVTVGAEVTVTCDAASDQQYVIIQSLDTSAEKLCIAEACVNAPTGVVTTAPATVPPTTDCLSSNKDTVQFTIDLESSLAVDSNVNTHSCTLDAEAFPWWAVDLGAEYSILSVTVTLPNTGGDTLNGLNNFQVGFPSVFPTAGSAVDRKLYPLCGTGMVGVTVGAEVTVNCAATTDQYRYVIIQSADFSAEKLCIAEACVKEGVPVAPTTVPVVTTAAAVVTTVGPITTAAAAVTTVTSTPSDCLSANKDTVQISTELSASFAVDNNVLTHSCTLDGQSYPWWVVDLGEELAVGSIQITLPSVNGANLNGLNKFQVGFSSALPLEGLRVQTDSYTVCGKVEVGVSEGLVLTVTCPISIATQQYRYVIVQSMDTAAEKLCIAEVCVNAAMTGLTTMPTIPDQTGNLAFEKPSLEITTEISADKGNDGLASTYSCTNDAEAFPWWAVDLEQEYYVGTVALTLPNAGSKTLNGLNNFRVGFPSTLPVEGSAVDRKSYPVCGDRNVGVTPGAEIVVDCAPSTQKYQYVIVQSLDTLAEALCIAEVVVKEGTLATTVPATPTSAVVVTTAGPAAPTTVAHVTTASTAAAATTAEVATTKTTETPAVETTTTAEEPSAISTPVAIALITLGVLYGTILTCCCCFYFLPRLLAGSLRGAWRPRLVVRPRRVPAPRRVAPRPPPTRYAPSYGPPRTPGRPQYAVQPRRRSGYY